MYRSRRKINYLGRLVRVRDCLGGYKLPDDIPQNALVKIVGHSIGQFHVDYRGQVYAVAMVCAELNNR